MQVVKYVRAIRKGWIKFDKPKEEPEYYLLWGDDSAAETKRQGLSYIAAPKPKLPGKNNYDNHRTNIKFSLFSKNLLAFFLESKLTCSACGWVHFSLSGHDESYNPSSEYIPTQEEINSYQLMYEEDRPKFIPRRYLLLSMILCSYICFHYWIAPVLC